ncbi:class I SAM-dependent methyltransferase (plasmid) [Azospirillum brasilense]|uniref:Class I SAM-dependent methyltransferase n=1 Tax=Azospirillum brasilense TaxID=192 RepID=A0A4D8R6Q3_AZOBR|nr:class I SAM-dependent methyltransferase [Azospirillum brasilense]QCO17631.1 class I SAM-dependent methyltransferase [Azospirillum brasilense]
MTDAADIIIEIYRRHGLAWESGRGRSLFEKVWLDRFQALLPCGGAVLDLGCGGADPLARYFIERGFVVTGVDTSPPLLGLARERFPEHRWLPSDMRGLFLAERFNGILAWNSFFHLRCEDQRRMFEVFRQHAAPGAALMFTSGPAHGEAIGNLQGEPLFHASLDGDEYRALLDAHGFNVVAHVGEDPECNGHTVWLARARLG